MTVIPSETPKVKTPCGTAYVTVGAPAPAGPYLSIQLAKPGGCLRLHVDVAARLSELAMRHGASLEEVAAVMAGHHCHQSSASVPSCMSAIAGVLRTVSAPPLVNPGPVSAPRLPPAGEGNPGHPAPDAGGGSEVQ